MAIVKGIETMTSTMKIVKLFECEHPELVQMFENYQHVLRQRQTQEEVENCRYVVDRYIKDYLLDSLFKYKLYSYKFFDAIKVEILLKPTETATVMEYHLLVGPDKTTLERVR